MNKYTTDVILKYEVKQKSSEWVIAGARLIDYVRL